MRVSDLSHLIQHLAEGLRPVASAGIVNDLAALRGAMAPFADRTVADFTKFLSQCEEFQRTGAVAGGRKGARGGGKAGADPARIGQAVELVRSLLQEIDHGQVNGTRIDEVLRSLDALGKPEVDQVLAGLQIVGATRTKKQGLDKIRTMITNQAEAGTRVQAMGQYR